uniref:Midasin n=1 Tax=Globodera pallida TaxID=36090 RepID=A0A183BMN5_GLOPA
MLASTLREILRLALRISKSVKGPHGCGKTHTAGQVAHRRSIPIKVLQINDQYDSKVLYGSYNCSEVPGAFLWQPSKFAQFLQQPCVILLKNLDHGGPDLAAAITDLAERGHAALANGRHIQMHTECRILGALSSDDHHHNHHLQQLWRDYPFTVKMGPLQLAQMDSILAATTKIHSELDNVRVKLLETFTAVSELILARKTSMDRALNAKDLFRVVRRLVEDHQQHTSVTDRCALFAELFDGWAAHLTGTELRHSVAAAIGEALSLSTEQQHYHMNVRHPDVSFLEENGVHQRVQIGRITLDRHEQQHNAERSSTNRPFVRTRDAAQLLERVAACVARSPPEPVLLTGDTGVGKTAIVQHIAHLSRVPLHVVNLSQESEFSDLVGGHKPTSATNILRPLVDDYVSLFRETFDAEKNAKFLDNLNHCFNAHRFADLVQLVVKSSSRALQKFEPLDACDTRRSRWTLLRQRARRLAKCFRPGGDDDGAWRRRLLFAHVKGVLTEAAERGDWLLVDEINLAPVECMDALVELLDPSSDFIVHANFRLFACMNSANDVGKRVLPLGIRSAFTEFYVDETRDEDQLRRIIRDQILSMDEAMVEAVLQFYMDVRSQFPGKFNLRTLSRALAVANDQQQQLGTAKHCLHRACAVAFVSQLDAEQRKRMQLLVTKWLGDVPTLARNAKLSADEMRKFVLIEGHKIPRGNEMPMFSDTNGIADDITETDNATTDESTYIFTPSVRANMALLASVVATGHFPILMEGETSAGKTSMVMQLAKMSGNRCFRINNHEHTDVQEYIGSYAPDATGRLEFVEGVLFSLSTRDLVTLSELFANFYIAGIPVHQALYHAIEANLLDALGVLPSRLAFDRQEVIDSCIKQLHTLIKLELGEDFTAATASSSHVQQQLELNADALSIGLFRIQCNRQVGGDIDRCRLPVGFSLDAPTTRRNAMRVARALASSKPVMLEGSPGAGKSSLVVALAAATGHKLVRLNLSEQTDLHDLFGGDVPVPDSDGSASFAWRDGPVLKAIKEGSWILLDEMNLASQSVLEGLNSCFDFRKRIYIAELDRTFELDSSRCKFFACQNPHQQGGARRALPKSFLNRFISIFVEEMTDDDFIHILCEFCKAQQQQMAGLMDNIDDDGSLSSPLFTEDRLAKMVLVNKLCRERVRELHQCGGPFEFNLRDLFRWVEAVDRFGGNFAFGFELVYLSRLTRQSVKDTV